MFNIAEIIGNLVSFDLGVLRGLFGAEIVETAIICVSATLLAFGTVLLGMPLASLSERISDSRRLWIIRRRMAGL
jgi:ABC-type uncharacterized transport system permease subunit